MNLSYNLNMRASLSYGIAFDFLMRDASILWQHSQNSYRNNVSSSYKKKIELFFKVVLFLFVRVDGTFNYSKVFKFKWKMTSYYDRRILIHFYKSSSFDKRKCDTYISCCISLFKWVQYTVFGFCYEIILNELQVKLHHFLGKKSKAPIDIRGRGD